MTLQKGTERLSERFHTVEIENQNLLKKLMINYQIEDSFFQDGNLHAIQIISKDEKTSSMEKFKTLESHVQNENQKLIDLMK